MILGKNSKLLGLLLWLINPVSLAGRSKLTTNTYEGNSNPSIFASVFSPRMDFDQWKPLTGRGDPLRNDPTYDYEPPVLEKVHYWADDREQERKSEVLVLGVSSRKPSVTTKPPVPPRRHTFPLKYENFAYKFGDMFPMTILVPPPPPPPGHNPSSYIISKEKVPMHIPPVKLADINTITRETTTIPELLVTSYALQEANLVYQASTTKQNWFQDYNNKTTSFPNNTVSSDYAGWGPTTPFQDNNDAHNLISYKDHQNADFTKEPLFYYKPVLSEAPPPPRASTIPLIIQTTLPPTISYTEDTLSPKETTTETTNFFTETTTEKMFINPLHSTLKPLLKPKPNIIDMLGPMLSMPMVTDPTRPEDNLYAHASDTIQIFKEPSAIDVVNLEIMQTMQPPPPIKFSENTTPNLVKPFNINPHILNSDKASHTHDPYLHMRFTTPMTVTVAPSQDSPSTTEAQSLPTYLIIQGHSKVKTYGSKPKASGNLPNKIPHPNETTEVKHLHPIKDKYSKKANNKTDKNREGRTQNLKSLIDAGLGSIEIQEADVGIKYDVSDGSDVPIEIYRKGIVDNDESDYSKSHTKELRNKRQNINLETVLPFNEDSLQEIVHSFFDNNKNNRTALKVQDINDTVSIEGGYDQEGDRNR